MLCVCRVTETIKKLYIRNITKANITKHAAHEVYSMLMDLKGDFYLFFLFLKRENSRNVRDVSHSEEKHVDLYVFALWFYRKYIFFNYYFFVS